MKKQYQFIEQLVQKLTEYNSIDQQITELDSQKKIIREQIENWLILHDSTLFEISDLNGQLWKLNKYLTTRNRVLDYDILKLVLPEEHKGLVSISESEAFLIKRINKHSKEWLIENN
jgi:hypothetical protein